MNTPENVRPWGRYDILEEMPTHQVKRITVNPGERLSYQRHKRREEFWVIILGRARFTLDDIESEHIAGDVLRIPFESKHRVACISDEPLVFIEVQRGDYFGEDDIERFEDDYGREGKTTPHGE
ncbi:phosphomannose isomerase type II C-terminal cupin domain [Candidatus Uhrbacteria bacterium]|nr:phosphomannose isomerase type II C-terminal cupin domain [Candidatus Uhrbacteria bacterium]